MVDVYDFCELCTDDSWKIAIYDFTTEEEVFRGSIRDAMDSDYAFCDVLSYDICVSDDSDVAMILNIETDDEDELD